jgi:hypothetical protein
MSSFFVGSDGVAAWASDTALQGEPRLGHEVRSCDVCGSDWGPTRCTSAGCTSMEFTTRYVEPVPIGARVMDRLRPQAKPKRATAAQAQALRGVRGSIAQLSDELTHLDDVLRRAVRDDGIEELQAAQAIANLAVSINGDASFARIAGLSLSLRATHAALNDAIKNLVEDTPK